MSEEEDEATDAPVDDGVDEPEDDDAAEDVVIEAPEQASDPARPKLVAAVVIAAIAGIAVGGLLFGGSDETPVASQHADHVDEATIWTCTMHPQVRMPEPGQCPICGMDLVPVQAGTAKPGPGEVRLSERARRLAEIRTSPVVRAGDAAVDLRLLGRLDFAESRQKTVTAWTGGRIDKLHINTTGEKIGKGQTIATIYSPEIYAAHQDLLTAKKQVATLSAGFARDSAQATLKAAQQKLRLLGVPDPEISGMEAAEAPWQSVRIRSPFSGTVIKRLVSEGSYIQRGTGLYELASLGELWVQLDAYESDLSRLAPNQSVRLEVSAYPGETFDGSVAFIDPVVDSKTRTARVRVQVDNSDGRLRPGMFATAVVAGRNDGSAPLVIPASAALFSGRRSIVYVERLSADETIYEAVEVRLGPRAGAVYPVVAGLNEGEHVVTHGAFALDADLQIRGGSSLMVRGDDTTHSSLDEILTVPKSFTDKLAPVVARYLDIQEALARDDLAAAREAAALMQEAAGAHTPLEPVEPASAWRGIRAEIQTSLGVLQGATTLEAARGPFERLTGAVTTLLHRFGNPLDDALRLAFCPMAFDNRGAEWLQRGDVIANAYFGERMQSCGEVRSIIAGGTHYVPPRAAPEPTGPPPGHQH